MLVKMVHSPPDRAPVGLLTGVGANVDTSSASTSLNPSTFPLCCGVQGRIYWCRPAKVLTTRVMSFAR
jgi:hypothetical protein